MENIRLNSSISKLKTVHKELQRLGQDISIQNNISYLIDPISDLWNEFENDLLKIDILYLSDNKSLVTLNKFVKSGTKKDIETLSSFGKVDIENKDILYRVYDENNFPIKKADTLPVVIKVLICESEDYEEEDLVYFAQRFSKEATIVFIEAPSDIQNKLYSVIRKFSWKAQKITVKKPWTDIEPNLKKVTNLTNLIGINLNYNKVSKALDSTINNEYKDLSARKITVHNDHMKLKKMGNSRVGQELFSSLKLNLQRSYSEFENGIQNRFDQLTGKKSGSMYSFIMDQIDNINDLQEVKSGNETKYFISNEIIKNLEKKTYDAFKSHLLNDIISLNDYFQVTVDEIDMLFKKEGNLGFNLVIDKLAPQDVNKQLEDQFLFEKEHEAKSGSKGFMSYFSKARMPIMVLMMLTSTLAIFYNPKDPEKGNIRNLTFYKVLAVIAIIAGAIYVIKSTKKEKENLKNEELKKIKQWLKSEYKRIFSNIEKDWKSMYFDSAKSRFSEILMQAETSLKSFQAARAESVSKETNLTQRKIQKLEAFDKKLNESKRKKSQIESSIKSIESDLKQVFLKLEI